MQNNTTAIKTGSNELDDILGGGLPANRVYLLHGTPGAGKTTLALQFLIEGARNKEKVLYITLSETKLELMATAKSHGWDLSGVEIFEMVTQENELQPENQYTMYQPSEVELSETTKIIIECIELIKPVRCVIDSLAEVKLLAQNLLRYRRQVLALKQFFLGRNCTTFFLDDKTASSNEDKQLESIAHGVISLEQLSPEYGAERRRLHITKLRGQKYRGGYHDFNIIKGGLSIFPRLVASEHIELHDKKQLKSGIVEFDDMLGGGIEYGASMLLLGPAGVGKSSLSIQYAISVAQEGNRAAIFTFDERIEMLVQRAEGIGQQLNKYIKSGHIAIKAIDPVELSPGEFAHLVRQKAQNDVKVIIIDSLNGYLHSMPEEHFLTAQLHELLTYLGHKNIVTILVVAQHGLLGQVMNAPLDTSYLADSVVLFRYFEAQGEVKQTISVLKKRTGKHEHSVREFKIENSGLRVGEKLRQFQGILSGTPTFIGNQDRLMKDK
ncbi:MAG: AAA family ATPase [Alphaproteobacteria bacterium]|nr:AAA family ATPase [Alphaproteobacteria bacterium]